MTDRIPLLHSIAVDPVPSDPPEFVLSEIVLDCLCEISAVVVAEQNLVAPDQRTVVPAIQFFALEIQVGVPTMTQALRPSLHWKVADPLVSPGTPLSGSEKETDDELKLAEDVGELATQS